MKKLLLVILFIGLIFFNLVDVLAIDYGEHPDHLYYITGQINHGDFDYYYGSAQNYNSGDFSGLLVIKNHETDTLFRTVLFDEGYRENFSFIGFFDDNLMGIVAVKFVFDYNLMSYVLKYTEVLLYDIFGNYINRIRFEESFKAFNNHGGYIILSRDSYGIDNVVINHNLELIELPDSIEKTGIFIYPYIGKAMINGIEYDQIEIYQPGYYEIVILRKQYQYSFILTLNPIIEGLIDGAIYQGSVHIQSLGNLYLNGVFMQNEMNIMLCGNHLLEIKGINGYIQEIYFTIDPIISGVIDGGEYTSGVYINANHCELKLNSKPYQSNTLIAIPGHYELQINGFNEYQKSINFTIYPSVVNLKNDDVFNEKYLLNFIGEGYLNGILIETGITLDEIGDYVFELWFDGALYQSYRFKIVNGTSNEHKPIRLLSLEIGLGIVSLIGLFLVIRKK